MRYENGCGRDEPIARHITEITQSIGDVRDVNEGSSEMRVDNEDDIWGIREAGGIREIRRGEMSRKNNSLRSNDEELRNSGMMDEDFYLNSTDASSIRDKHNEVIGQWI